MKTFHLDAIPSSVYRLQLNAEFPLKKAIAIIPYLHQLGVDGVYCSPLFHSASPNGYDVINPNTLNPILGTQEEYETFCKMLQSYHMSQVLDIIPNHMGIKHNPWWLDVLEYGKFSTFAEFFDIDWHPGKKELINKVLLPILGESYGKTLEEQKIHLDWNEGFWISYQDYRLPVAPFTYSFILEYPFENTESLETKNSLNWQQCLEIAYELKKIQSEEPTQLIKKKEKKKELIACYHRSNYVRSRFNSLIYFFNGHKGNSQSFDPLHELLQQQFYRLSHWRTGGQEINYRRFFNINELVGLHIENKKILDLHHSWIFDLISSGKIQGLRIDHPDGLYNPQEYFIRLRNKSNVFIVVEKILDFQERLPEKWAVEGSVGYDFLNVMNGVFVQKNHEHEFQKIYEKFVGGIIDFESLLYERKKWFIRFHMGSEINSLGWYLDQLSEKNRFFRDFTRADLTAALKEVIACFPVYRTYWAPGEEISKKDRDYIIAAVEDAKNKAPEIDLSVYEYIRDLLLLKSSHLKNEQETKAVYDFILRFQQLTGPIMAKGLEDSCYYIYNRLISLNEVGGMPLKFGFSKSEFHQFNCEKQEKWPLGFLSSSTHDTKFSEDVRMRINVLSEIPDKWERAVESWKVYNQKNKQSIHGILFPDSNTEYYLYQMLLGVWPERTPFPNPSLLERLWECLLKITREAGLFTSWRNKDDKYEKIVKDFFFAIFSEEKSNLFMNSFLCFHREISYFGHLNSLSALVLKMGSCGIVDIYQGNELWNYTLLDPDSRRPIDYGKYEKSLKQIDLNIKERESFLKRLLLENDEGKIKLYCTVSALQIRKKYKTLFLKGTYIPLVVEGEYKDNVIAFMRQYEDQVFIVAVTRFFTQLDKPHEQICLKKTHIIISKFLESKTLNDVFTHHMFRPKKIKDKLCLSLEDIFSYFPWCMLTNEKV